MPSGFGLLVQRLRRGRDRVLAIATLAGARNETGWFTPGQVADLFETLRLPRPGNISEDLRRLQTDGLVVRRRSGGQWAVTPEGDETLQVLIGSVDAPAVEAEMSAAGSAEFAGEQHPLIPADYAPLRFRAAVRRLLAQSPFERNVFCMTRFPRSQMDPVGQVLKTVRDALAGHGLTMHVASDRSADDELFNNVAAHIWGCKYGIALLETGPERPSGREGHLNDNVLIEIGAMLVTGRRCGLLKDVVAPKPPSDFVAQIYKEIDFTDGRAVEKAVDRWVKMDLVL